MIGLLSLFFVGSLAGFLVTRIMGLNLPLVQTIGVGVFGAVLGTFILRTALAALGAFAGLIGAFLGTIALVWAYKKFIQDRR